MSKNDIPPGLINTIQSMLDRYIESVGRTKNNTVNQEITTLPAPAPAPASAPAPVPASALAPAAPVTIKPNVNSKGVLNITTSSVNNEKETVSNQKAVESSIGNTVVGNNAVKPPRPTALLSITATNIVKKKEEANIKNQNETIKDETIKKEESNKKENSTKIYSPPTAILSLKVEPKKIAATQVNGKKSPTTEQENLKKDQAKPPEDSSNTKLGQSNKTFNLTLKTEPVKTSPAQKQSQQEKSPNSALQNKSTQQSNTILPQPNKIFNLTLKAEPKKTSPAIQVNNKSTTGAEEKAPAQSQGQTAPAAEIQAAQVKSREIQVAEEKARKEAAAKEKAEKAIKEAAAEKARKAREAEIKSAEEEGVKEANKLNDAEKEKRIQDASRKRGIKDTLSFT